MKKLCKLSLGIKLHEQIVIGNKVHISFSKIGSKVRIHIEAPPDIDIKRINSPTDETPK